MSQVISDMSMSLDGFIVGSDADYLHDWLFKGPFEATIQGIPFHMASEVSARILRTLIDRSGAVVLGKQAFQAGQEHPPFQLPCFVLSHEAQDTTVKDGTTVTFVTDGIESALAQARTAAGDKDVYVFGGANTIQQFISAGLLDELQIDLIPILQGSGPRLFEHLGVKPIELECTQVAPSQGVTHLIYRIVK